MPSSRSHITSSTHNSNSHSSNVLSRVIQRSRRHNESIRHQLPLACQSLVHHSFYRHNLGPCNIICSSCNALHWIEERSYRSTIDNPSFYTCCQNGQVNLTAFPDAPEPLKSLLQDNTDGIFHFY